MNLKKMGLSGIPADGKELIQTISSFEIPESLKDALLQTTDVYYALSILLDYSVISVDISIQNSLNLYKNNDNISCVPKTMDFFDELLAKHPDNLCVDMAFHAGSAFFRSSKYVELLNYLVDNKSKIRVIINVGDNTTSVITHMRQKNHKYDPLSEVYKDWLQLEERSGGQLQVRATQVPLLHRTYFVYSESDVSYGAVHTAFYTYGNDRPNSIRTTYSLSQPEANILRNEFEYLWNKCCDILEK